MRHRSIASPSAGASIARAAGRSRVERFRCRSCGKTFSWQTLRHDRCDRRSQCKKRVFELLTSGVGQRQSARLLGLGLRSVQAKMRRCALRAAEPLRLPLGGPSLPANAIKLPGGRWDPSAGSV
jgi:transposase-like protein